MGKSVEKPRIHIVSARLTDEEMESLQARSKAFKMPISEIVRNGLVRNSQRCAGCEGKK